MSEWLTGLFWWFLVLSVLVPMIRQRIVEVARIRCARLPVPDDGGLRAGSLSHPPHPRRPAVTVFVPPYAMSGGTLIALAADNLVMDENAALGPIDPQLIQQNEGPYPVKR